MSGSIACLEIIAGRRGCPLLLELPDEEIVVDGDAARLQQVQVNLLTNAIRHSRPGEPICLSVGTQGPNALISISDIGEGIRPEMHTKVFDLFYQTNAQMSRQEGGLGVGLSLVRHLVAKHDGLVTLHSECEGLGTTFEVTLPLAKRTEVVKPKKAEGAIAPMRIVIVEDQEANRKMLKMMLELDGHTVWEADYAADGIELIGSELPDLALVDIGLPDMPGYEVARDICGRDPRPATLLAALSGFGQSTDVQKAHEAGFDVHLVKPLDMDKLMDFLKGACQT